MEPNDPPPLRRGWTTGACATAAAVAAHGALFGDGFPDPVEVHLPGGQVPAFALALEGSGPGWARAGIVKDAGDDPDVTHGVTVITALRSRPRDGAGLRFLAGPGVGTVTLPGLPLGVGEPAINPGPRRMVADNLGRAVATWGGHLDLDVEVSVPGGEAVAVHTWNPRLGILGGLSILGTTGVVVPYSCSAWIHSIHRGVDVARAIGHPHVAGSTGSASEAAVRARFGLPDTALLDMGDFAGGLLKYLRRHPVPALTIAGGFAKLSKLAVGHLDLHSGRSQVDLPWLVEQLAGLGAPPDVVASARDSVSALGVLQLADAAGLGSALAAAVAEGARRVAAGVLEGAPVAVGVVVVDRDGVIRAEAGGPAGT